MASTTTILIMAIAPAALAQSYKPDQTVIDSYPYNRKVIEYTIWTWVAIIAVLFIHRWTVVLLQHVRHLANLNQSTSLDNSNYTKQRYFSIPNDRWSGFKRHIFLAPLFRHRHNDEFRLSAATNVGTLPARLDAFFLLGYFALNGTMCFWHIDWHAKHSDTFAILRNRAGILSVLNMIPLFLFAGRNNPLIWLLGLSFDTYNLFHRWIGRIVVVEAMFHTAFYMAGVVSALGTEQGWKLIKEHLASSPMLLNGAIAAGCFAFILLHSPSIIRHAFYETFLHTHIILAFVASVTIWIHIKSFPSSKVLLAAIIFWGIERLRRFWSLVRNSWGPNGRGTARIEAIPGDAIRVTLRISRPWKFQPGQHVYLYIPSIGMWTSHPFSLAWSDAATDFSTSTEKILPMARQDIAAAAANTVSLVIRRRTGFTDTLYRQAERTGPSIRAAFVEGPYTNGTPATAYHSYGTVMLFAAGIGITHQVPHIRDLVAAYASGIAATRKLVLVWTIQSPEHLEWIRPWMTQILGMERRRDILRIMLFVTRPRSTREIHSPSATVQMFPGRPDVGALIAKEQEKQVGAMAVSVCGTGSLSDDVRSAVREKCTITEMDFFEEAFSW